MMLRQRVTHMWRTGQYIKPADSGFHPRQIYVPGVQGAMYRPRDLSTLFQDSAGTTPVTAMEQPVGRMLDISGNGNHAFQTTPGKRPVVSRRVNLFTESEFRNGVADAPTRSALVTAESITGYLGALGIGWDGSTTVFAYKNILLVSGATYQISAVVKMDDGNPPVFGSATPTSSLNTFIFGGGGAFATYGTYIVTPLGGGEYRVSATVVAGATNISGLVKYPSNDNRTFKVTAYDIRLSIDAHLPYQRVNTATNYDDNAFKFPTYLRCDGAATVMQTNAIDFTGTDKMTVVAGFRKSSDAALGYLLSMGLSGGRLDIRAPASAGSNISANAISSAGASIFATTAALGVAANTDINYAAIVDFAAAAGSECTSRVNGVVVPQTGGLTQENTGVFGSQVLTIGALGSASYFAGRIYPLIVAGAQMTPTQLAASEAWTAAEMMVPA